VDLHVSFGIEFHHPTRDEIDPLARARDQNLEGGEPPLPRGGAAPDQVEHALGPGTQDRHSQPRFLPSGLVLFDLPPDIATHRDRRAQKAHDVGVRLSLLQRLLGNLLSLGIAANVIGDREYRGKYEHRRQKHELYRLAM